jgi:hypothetical protein
METISMNANDATLTELTTAQNGSMVEDNAPNASAGRRVITVPAAPAFEVVVGVAAAHCTYPKGRERDAR